MERRKATDFPQEVLDLFDGYVHGAINRREFLDRAARYAVGGFTAAAIYFVVAAFTERDGKWPFGFMAISCVFMFLVGLTSMPTCTAYADFRTGFPTFGSLLVGVRTLVAYVRREQGRDWIVYLVLLVTSPLWGLCLQRLCRRVF